MANQYQYSDYSQFQYPNDSGDSQFMQGYGLSQQMNDVGTNLFGGPSMSGFPAQYPFSNNKNSSNFPCDYSQLRQFGSDMQQTDQFLPGVFNNSAAGNFYDNFSPEQDFTGFDSTAFMQRPGKMGRGFGGFPAKRFQHNQRGGMNRFANDRKSNTLPSVTNPNGLRDDTVFVSNLPQNIDHDAIKSNFANVGKIKTNPKTGMPMIWIFKERGIPKGDALVTYEDTSCVQAAIKYFSDNEFQGKKIIVKQAKNSQHPVIIPPGGGNFNSGGFAADNMTSMPGRGGFDANSDGAVRNFGRNSGNPRLPGNLNRPGDWVCKICSTGNFSSRDQCIQCSAPRLDDANPKRMVGMVRGGPSRMGPSRGVNNGIPPFLNNGGGMMGRGNMQMRGRGTRGGGPIRGRALTGGRMRPTPY